MSNVIYLENGLCPQNRQLAVCSGKSIKELAPDWPLPYIVFVDNEPILRADWELVPEDEQTVFFVDVQLIPQGGGGGGNSDPLRTVLMIAIIVMAPEIGAFMGPGIFGAGVLGLSATTWTGIAMFAGMSLLNAILPPPKLPTNQQAAALAAPSPTYSLQAQGNTARLDGAIPEHFGRMLAYPDFAAQPYSEFEGNEQYLYQLFCIGRGHYYIESIRIEDTPISTFDGITTQVIIPGATLSLFPSTVTTSTEVSGISLGCTTANYSRTTTLVTITSTSHGLSTGALIYVAVNSGTLVAGDYTVVSAPTVDTFTFTTAASGATSGSVNWANWAGPFTANASGTLANKLGFDLVAPKGLYYANDDGSLATVSTSLVIEAQTINDLGVATGAWVQLTTGTNYGPWSDWKNSATTGTNTSTVEYQAKYNPTATIYTFDPTPYLMRTRYSTTGGLTYSGATTTPQRYSFSATVTAARYSVRVRRTDVENKGTRYGHALAWGTLRSYLQGTQVFGDVTLLAMKMKASNNLSSQSSRKVNVIATRKLPVWNGSAWVAINTDYTVSTTTTRSPSWAFAYACKQVGLTDAQLNLASLLTLANTCAARPTGGDTFDARFDNFITFWEAVSKVLGAVRTKPFLQAGMMRVMRDEAASIPVAMYSPRNIVKGSLSINYLMPTEDTADAVVVKYFDNTNWKPYTVTAKLPGSSALVPAKIDLFGVVDRNQAYREGLYYAATNRYRRKTIKFQTEMEGFIPSFGDLIAISHDMPAWGQAGEVTGWNSGTRALVLSEPALFSTGTHYIGLRKRDGSVDGPFVATQSGIDNYTVILAITPSFTPYTGTNEERTHYSFGPSEAWRQPARVLAVRPKNLNTVEIECVNEDANVHTADSGVTTPSVIYSQLAGYRTSPVMGDVSAKFLPFGNGKISISWSPVPWAVSFAIEQSPDGINWIGMGSTSANGFMGTAIYGTGTQIRVAAINLARGAWTQISITPTPIPTDVTSISNVASVDGVVITWIASTDVYFKEYEVRVGGANWLAATVVGRTSGLSMSFAPMAAGTYIWRVKKVDDTGQMSANDANTTLVVGLPNAPVPTVVNVVADEIISWPIPTSLFALSAYEIRYGATWIGATVVTTVKTNSFRQKLNYVGSRNYLVAAIDTAGNVSVAGSVSQNIVAPGAPTSTSVAYVDGNVTLSWQTPSTGTLPIASYEIRFGAIWSTATPVTTLSALSYTFGATWLGGRSFLIAAIDVAGNVSAPATQSATILSHSAPTNMAASIAGQFVVLSWDSPVIAGGLLPVRNYEIRRGASWAAGSTVAITADTKIQIGVDWTSSATFFIAITDINGVQGVTTGSVISNITGPGIVSPIAGVVGTNLVLSWSAPSIGSLPIAKYEVRQGATWAAGAAVGGTTGVSLTTPVTWLGARTFWVAAIDTAGNVATAASAVGTITAHTAVSVLTATLVPATTSMNLTWTASSGSLPVSAYEIRYGAVFSSAVVVGFSNTNTFTVPADWTGTRLFWVVAKDTNGIYGTELSVSSTINTLASPVVSGVIILAKLELSWPTVTGSFPVKTYEIRYGASWAAGTMVAQTTTNNYRVPINWIGARSFWVSGYDDAGNLGATGTLSFTVTGPTAPTILVSDTSVGGALLDQYRVAWNNIIPTASQLPIDHYTVGYGAVTLDNVSGTSYLAKAVWSGLRTFWVQAVDINGNVSTQTSTGLTVTPPAAPSTMTAQVVDNNVLLYWGLASSTLPVTTFELAKEPTFNINAPATYIGLKSGGFTTVFETTSGSYTYYLRAIDSAGNPGTSRSVAATVAQPPDYVLNKVWNSTFAATFSNAINSNGLLTLPVNLTETWTTHFTGNAYTSPQDQITAGYLYYDMPTPASGYYEEIFDYGTSLPATKVTVTLNAVAISAPSLTIDISTSLDNISYTLYSGVTSVYATNFRYVKVRVTVNATGANDQYEISALTVTLDSKLKGDAGMKACLATDTGGTITTFNIAFIDVSSITVTALSTTPVYALYDFVDTPNPTSFKILLFNSAGARVSGTASWSVKGY